MKRIKKALTFTNNASPLLSYLSPVTFTVFLPYWPLNFPRFPPPSDNLCKCCGMKELKHSPLFCTIRRSIVRTTLSFPPIWRIRRQSQDTMVRKLPIVCTALRLQHNIQSSECVSVAHIMSHQISTEGISTHHFYTPCKTPLFHRFAMKRTTRTQTL